MSVNSPILGMSSDLMKKDRMAAAFRGAAGNRTRFKKASGLRKAQSDYAKQRESTAKLPANTRKVLTARVRWHGHVGFGAGQSARTPTAMAWPSSSIQVAPSPVAGLSTAQTPVVHWAPGRRAAGPAATPRAGI